MLTVQPAPAPYPRLDRLLELIGPDRARRLHEAADRLRQRLAGGTLWHVNSTGAGGGVAEMLHTSLPLCQALGIPVGWLVIGGDDPFFRITKRLGAALYGSPGDGLPLGPAEREVYLSVLAGNAEAARQVVTSRDVLLLHDHQTAGLAPLLRADVSGVYWRCHVGVDQPDPVAAAGWRFLEPLLEAAAGAVFSVPWHVPEFLRHGRVAVIPPFISPFSAKNCDLSADAVRACLIRCGLRPGEPAPAGIHTPAGLVSLRHPVETIADRPPEAGEPLLVQVSRWDRLKDMHGVLTAFAGGVGTGYLALVGPSPAGIPDDVEQADWFARCLETRRALPEPIRRRTGLICLPMDDLVENAALVNAVQRASDVVIQKSLAEGFGLTVTEAMWKSRLVAASAVGGLRTQIDHGDTGLLAAGPSDLDAFGALLASAVDGSVDRVAVGERARHRVHDRFLPDRDVTATAALLTS